MARGACAALGPEKYSSESISDQAKGIFLAREKKYTPWDVTSIHQAMPSTKRMSWSAKLVLKLEVNKGPASFLAPYDEQYHYTPGSAQ